MAEEVIGAFDIVEAKPMRNQGFQIDPAGGDDRHQPPHPLLATWAERGHDPVVTQAGGEGAERDRKVRRIDAEA